MKRLLFVLFILVSLPSIAQDIIVTNAGESIKVKNIDCSSADFVYYQLFDQDSTTIQRMKKSDVLIIRMADGTKLDPNTSEKAQPAVTDAAIPEESNFPIVDLSQYHGFLLDKGNCVYITYNSDVDYEKAGVERLKTNMRNLGYWTVVDKPEQAHFILQYGVCLKGQDRTFVYLRTRDSYASYPICAYDIWMYKISEPESIIYAVLGGSEDVNDNTRTADILCTRTWKTWEKNLSKEKKDKRLQSIFYKQ